MKGRVENEIKESKRMDKLLENYESYMREFYDFLDEKSYTTKRNYINYVSDMLNGTLGNTRPSIDEIKGINTGMLQRYMNSLKYTPDGKKIGASIRAARWSGINIFFKFLLSYQYIDENPFVDKVQRPQIKNDKEVVYLNEAEIQEMLDNVESLGRGIFQKRDKAIIMLCITTGLRKTAVTEINLEDINFEDGSILTTNKGEKTWAVYGGYKTMKAIKEWIEVRDTLFRENDEKTDALFISSVRKRITPQGITDIVKKYSSTLDKHITPHKLRSTCATNLYKQTGDILLVAETLGHEDVSVTKRYTKVEESARKRAGDIMNGLL